MPPERSWDAASYDRIGTPMTAMAAAVLERLELRGDETVVDAGCGTGRVSELLLERLPHGRLLALDADAAMVARARATLGARVASNAGERARVAVRHVDLLDLHLDPPVDVVFSTATFHWVLDHERLFLRLLQALVPGGRLVAQCGGAGNIVDLLAAADEVARRSAFEPAFAGWSRPMRYATAEETTDLLRAAGFVDVRCWLEPWPVTPAEPLEYLATVPLGAHLDRLVEDRRRPFVEAVAALLPSPITVGYVRLNIDARRPA
ncbi:MAG: methyltransferase domain-containing protein [Acidimicrobiia bacterium]|nr:methyltransferase domain-containing protein [Acidimicrobiia bacterium]